MRLFVALSNALPAAELPCTGLAAFSAFDRKLGFSHRLRNSAWLHLHEIASVMYIWVLQLASTTDRSSTTLTPGSNNKYKGTQIEQSVLLLYHVGRPTRQMCVQINAISVVEENAVFDCQGQQLSVALSEAWHKDAS